MNTIPGPTTKQDIGFHRRHIAPLADPACMATRQLEYSRRRQSTMPPKKATKPRRRRYLVGRNLEGYFPPNIYQIAKGLKRRQAKDKNFKWLKGQ